MDRQCLAVACPGGSCRVAAVSRTSREVAAIPRESIVPERDEKEQKEYYNVKGLQAAQDNFTLRGLWPSAGGWKHARAEVVTHADLTRFHDTLRAMVSGVANAK